MSWQLAILLHGFLGSLRDIQNKRIGLHTSDYSLYALFVAFFVVFSTGLTIAIYRSEPIFFQMAWQARYFLLFGGFSLGLQNYLIFKIYRILPASIVAILSLMNPLAVVLIASLVVGERLTSAQILGALMLLSCVLLLNLKVIKKDKIKKTKHKIGLSIGFLTAVAIAVLFGIGIVNERYLLERLGLSTYIVFGWGAQFLSAIIIVLLNKKRFVVPKKLSTHIQVWSSGLLLGVAGFMFVLSQFYSSSSSLSSLGASFKVVLSVILSYIILKERDNLIMKLICVSISTTGLYLLLI